jgi:hypothetical protein
MSLIPNLNLDVTTCGGVYFGEEFSEAGNSCFGAKEVSWDYVLFIGLDLRIVGVS